MRPFLFFLLASAIAAADIDPWTQLDRMANARLLATLRDRWGTADQPDSQLAIAQMALVNLALSGDLRERGNLGGIWRVRARELGGLRTATPATFHDRIPQLWSDALDGRSTVVVHVLDQAGFEADSPHGRALRACATGDWRPLLRVADPTPIERLALARCYSLTDQHIALSRLRSDDDGTLSGFAGNTLAFSASWYTDVEQARNLLTEALRAVPPICTSQHLPAEAKRTELVALQRSLDLDAGKPVDPGEWGRRLPRQAGNAAAVVAAYRLCEASLAAPRGVRGADGTWILLGLGDWARDTRYRLYLAATQHLYRVRASSKADATQAVAKPYVTADRDGTLGAMIAAIAVQWRTDQPTGAAVLAAIERELAREDDGLDLCQLASACDNLRDNSRSHAQAATALMGRIADQQARQAPHLGAGWAHILARLDDNQRATLRPTLDAVRTIDRWNGGLYEFSDPEELTRRMPWRVDLLDRLADAAADRNDWQTALTLSEAALAAHASYRQLGITRGRALEGLGRLDEAVAAWTTWLAQPGVTYNTQARRGLARVAEARDDLAAAATQWAEIGERDGCDGRHDACRFFVRHRRWEEARRWAKAETEKCTSSYHKFTPIMVELSRSDLTPRELDDVERQLRGLRGSLRANLGKNHTWQAFQALRFQGRGQTLLELLNESLLDAHGDVGLLRGFAQLDAGSFAEATDSFATAASSRSISRRAVGGALILQCAAARMAGLAEREPEPGRLLATLSEAAWLDGQHDVVRYLLGQHTREATAQALAANRDADTTWVVLALLDLADGRRADAQAIVKRLPEHTVDGASLRRILALPATPPAAPKPSGGDTF